MSTKTSSLGKLKITSDDNSEMQEEIKISTKDKCMCKLNECLLYITTTTIPCPWGLTVDRITMHV